MTNQEALKAVVGLPAGDHMISKALIDNDLPADAPYIKASQPVIDLAAVQVLEALKSTKTISEGNFTLTVDTNAVNERLRALSGIVPQVPTVQDGSYLW